MISAVQENILIGSKSCESVKYRRGPAGTGFEQCRSKTAEEGRVVRQFRTTGKMAAGCQGSCCILRNSCPGRTVPGI